MALSRSEAGDRAAQEIYRVIPWARSDRPEASHQAQIKAEIDELRASIKRSQGQGQQSPKRQKQQRKRGKDQGLGM